MFWKDRSCDISTCKLLQSLGENGAPGLAPCTWTGWTTPCLRAHPGRPHPPPAPQPACGFSGGLPGKGARGSGGPQGSGAAGGGARTPPPPLLQPGAGTARGRRRRAQRGGAGRHLARSGEGVPRAPAYLAREVRVRSGDAGRVRRQPLPAALQVSEALGSPGTPLLRPATRTPPSGRPPPRSPSPPAVYSGERGPLSRAFPPPGACTHTPPPEKRSRSEGAATVVLEILGLRDFGKPLLKSLIYPVRFRGGAAAPVP